MIYIYKSRKILQREDFYFHCDTIDIRNLESSVTLKILTRGTYDVTLTVYSFK